METGKWADMTAAAARDGAQAIDREITRTYAEIESSTDRGCAIVSAAFIEDRLQRAICRRLLDDSRSIKKITSPSGALVGFENKIQFGYLLGVYIADTRDNLLIIGQIRNKFAHRTQVRYFDDPALTKFFEKLTLARRILPPEDPLSIMVVDALTPQSTRRQIFMHVIHRILGFFAYDDFGRAQETFTPLF
jgi:hypothetical protein